MLPKIVPFRENNYKIHDKAREATKKCGFLE
jgi:hypothetical protein